MKTSVKIALAVVLFIAAGGILAALYLYNLKPKDLRNVNPHFVIGSSDLQKEFEADEKGSSAKYIDKIIEVTGEIITITGGEKSSWNISLQTGSDFSKVTCTFQNIKDPGVFAPGKQITIRGVCSGVLSDVLLNNCAVTEYPK
ncbi:MAG: hypothetical protein C0408_06490 [Odoribacter sp.]|nr:hypothetical protein [Odoribacter sp.]